MFWRGNISRWRGELEGFTCACARIDGGDAPTSVMVELIAVKDQLSGVPGGLLIRSKK
jgi:hypothetical protein